ncbi:MAG: AI-2E family transporter [Gemmataceae bacterium]|nr:AI-2E family transporter [Gemmataceae bacterium]
MTSTDTPEPADPKTAAVSDRPRLVALGLLTLVGVVVCGLVAYPFLPALAWAVALAIVAYPMHHRLAKVIPWPNVAATVSTAVVVVVLLVPVVFVGGQLAQEATAVGSAGGRMAREGWVEGVAGRLPYGPQAVDWVRANVDVEAQGRRLLSRLVGDATLIAQGTAAGVIQALVGVFVLFFAFRDGRHLRASARGLSPLTTKEAEYLFRRVSDSVYATVYATVLTATLQGVTGGLMFWLLGLPAPVLWGVIMTALGIIPILGAFLVWVPAAVYLATEERWGAAAALVGWGVVMAGPVCNTVYAWLAGGRMRLHPVPVLVAYVGGLAVFGISGMVLGPVVLAVTVGLIDVWRHRLDPHAAPAPATAAGDWAEPGRVPHPAAHGDRPADLRVSV